MFTVLYTSSNTDSMIVAAAQDSYHSIRAAPLSTIKDLRTCDIFVIKIEKTMDLGLKSCTPAPALLARPRHMGVTDTPVRAVKKHYTVRTKCHDVKSIESEGPSSKKGKVSQKKRKLNASCDHRHAAFGEAAMMDIDLGSAYSSRKENDEVHVHVELKRSEAYYQRMLEVILGGGHKMLDSGTTDITTDSFHAEIKKWSAWKHAVGQLLCYNADDPRDDKRIYLFGQRCNEDAVTRCTAALGIELYAVDDVVGGISITRLPEDTTQIYKLKLL